MTTTSTMDLRDCVTFHQLTLSSAGRAPATQRLYLLYERKFIEYLESQRIAPTLDALNAANVRAALEWFRGQVGDGTRGGQVSAAVFINTLKTWANFLEAEEIVEVSPLRKVKKVSVPKILRTPFTQAEMLALWGACRLSSFPTRDEALFLLLVDTGVRIGEASTITLDKLQLDQHQIVVGLEGKGRRERIVPIGDPTKRDGGRAIRALRQYLNKRPESIRGANRVFLGRDGYPISAEAGTSIIKRLGKAAGVENVHPHRLRHTWATWYLTVHPGDELGLRRIIGHASHDVMADYVHLSQTTLAQRAGQASLAEMMGPLKPAAPSRPDRFEPIMTAWRPPAPARTPEPVQPPRNALTREARADELLELVRSDRALRTRLLQALLEEGEEEQPRPKRRWEA